MDSVKKSQALQVLNYYKIVEFLGQNDIDEKGLDVQKTMAKLEKAQTNDKMGKKIEIFFALQDFEGENFAQDFTANFKNLDLERLIKWGRARYLDYEKLGEEVQFCLGKIARNAVVEYLEPFYKNKDENPELNYPQKSAIAWFSFKTDASGAYLQGSFALSPILWAICEWEKSRGDFHLNLDKYDELVKCYDEGLQGENVADFLENLYDEIKREFVSERLLKLQENLQNSSLNSQINSQNHALNFELNSRGNSQNNSQPNSQNYLQNSQTNSRSNALIPKGFMVYKLYKDEAALNKDENPTDYAELGKSFYLNDLSLLIKLIENDEFGGKNAYEKALIEYILSAHHKAQDIAQKPPHRTDISPKQPQAKMRAFFEEILNVKNAPLGKWPAKFMPALMQQVAVNLAIKNDDKTPIFSVNGPPGTGKTTLLKEIVANHIVARAHLLAQAEDADELFERRIFKKGPLQANENSYCKFAPAFYALKNDAINDYAMLVASCNNAAVENITLDLPKAADILTSLGSEGEEGEIKRGLDEVRALFDINETEDKESIKSYKKEENSLEKMVNDIYFTRYAEGLRVYPKKNSSEQESWECWGLISAPLGKRANIKAYADSVLKPFLKDYNQNETREKHKEKFRKIKEKFTQHYKYVENLRAQLQRECENSALNSAANSVNLNSANSVNLNSTVANSRDLNSPNSTNLISQANLPPEKKFAPIDDEFMQNYCSKDEKQATKAQITNPYFTPEYNRAREKLFLYACKLHKEFAVSSKCLCQNIINLLIAWGLYEDCDERMHQDDKEAAMPCLLQSVFLLTPVISTTFASAQRFLSDIKTSGVIGTLIVDEAGQAQPQEAIGAMFRCKKAIIVGDPKQIEPVVTAETDMIKHLLDEPLLASYKDKKLSVQGFADYINPYGTLLGRDDEQEWVGCPLVVHRRCIEPMYSISNTLSYDGTMKQQTAEPKPEKARKFILEKSCWINVKGAENAGKKDHFVRAQGEVVLTLLKEKMRKNSDKIENLFIITPFTSVKEGITQMINATLSKFDGAKKWLDDGNIGTVHTFQGQGTDEVIFLLGCDEKSTAAAKWVNKNIVNVAATRAKFRLYIIGDESVWECCKSVRVARELTANTIEAENLVRSLDENVRMIKALGAARAKKMGLNSAFGEKSPENSTLGDIKIAENAGAKTSGVKENDAQTAQEFLCPKCKVGFLREIDGKFGKFFGCTRFKDGCDFKANSKDGKPDLSRFEPNFKAEFSESDFGGNFKEGAKFKDGVNFTKIQKEISDYACPQCQKGKLVRREDKKEKGVFWYGCSEFKNGCRFTCNEKDGKPNLR